MSHINIEIKARCKNPERLEFLGDKVLGLALSQFLYRSLPDSPEGKLTAIVGVMASGRMLAEIAETLELGELIFMSKGERTDFDNGKRSRLPIMENVFEALVGAIYLDRGIGIVELFLQNTLFVKLPMVISKNLYLDAKSCLQDVVQGNFEVSPHYSVLETSGSLHEVSITVGVYCAEKQLAVGIGPNKKLAEIDAAHNALESEFQITLERF